MLTTIAFAGACWVAGDAYAQHVHPKLRRAFRRGPIGLPAGGPQSNDARYLAEYRRGEAIVRQEVEQRRLEEIDNTRGAQMWFSRYTKHGLLKHWVLVINNIKYELRRDSTTGRYERRITPNCDLGLGLRRLELQRSGVPVVGEHYVCLIGWTRYTPDQIEQICAQVDREFGEYQLLLNNCHHFLRMLAERVVSEYALDWPWFYSNVRTRYQEGMRLPEPPRALVERQKDAAAYFGGVSISQAPSLATAAHPVAAHSTTAHSGVAHAGAAHAVAGHSAGVVGAHVAVASVVTGAAALNAYNGGGWGGGGC